MTELTTNDYKKILEYYDKPVPKSARLIKAAADKILAKKLCRCIKKVEKNVKSASEGRAIGICTKTIFNSKGITRGKFKCKGKQSVKTRKIRK
jgi:hypothetical protein